MMKLEICASNFKSAENAQLAGAHRIELCTDLAVGGLTPSYGLLYQVSKHIDLEKFVLIRPRGGNFTYSEREFEQMLFNIDLCKELGYDGIVSGVLLKDQSIDVMRTIELVNRARPMSFTFHRAFDWVNNPNDSLEDLINIGVDRVLTSGQQPSAVIGLSMIQSLMEDVQDNLIILPGGGIQPENVHLFKEIGCTEVHASLTTLKTINQQPTIPMNASKFYDETIDWYSDIEKIKNLIEKL